MTSAATKRVTKRTAKIEQETEEIEGNGSLQRLIFRFLWLALIMGLCVLIYDQLTRDDVLPIQEIKVSGEFNQLLSQDFQPIIANGVNGNFFTVNVDEMYQQLLILPWVEKVWIHRIWPDTIKIDLQEEKPVAILKNKGLLNKKGQVFSHNVGSFDKILPQFVVAKNYTAESIKQFEKNSKILRENGLKPQVFYYDERKSQRIKLSNGIELILGRVDVEERLIKFVKAYKMQLQNETRKILKVDLRYTNGLAVSWKQSVAKIQPLFRNQQA